MTFSVDPVAAGFVASLSKPGGNVTGLTQGTGVENRAKLLQLLKEAVPGLSTVGILYEVPGSHAIADIDSAARSLGLRPVTVGMQRVDDIDAAFASIVRQQAGAFVLLPSAMSIGRRQQFADLGIHHRLPGIANNREYAAAGLPIAFGANLLDNHRRAAVYVDKILRGAKPADLPVEQARTFEFVINLKTARALGLVISSSLLLRADRVIE